MFISVVINLVNKLKEHNIDTIIKNDVLSFKMNSKK